MNVLKNNYNPTIEQDKVSANKKTYPRVTICEWCESELEYNKSDMYAGEFGCMKIDCLCCGKATIIENEEPFLITADNIDFPIHFYHTSIENGAVECCDNKHIREYLKQAIKYFRENKDEYSWYTETGNLYICVQRYEEDECYDVTVSKDYYSTTIYFQHEDYRS